MKLSEYLKINRMKLIKSCFCFISFFGLGGCCTLLGSSLLDLQIRMGLTFSEVSDIVPSRSIGYLIGGVLSGFLDSCFTPDLVLFFTNFTAGIFIALAPWFKQFNGVYACLLLSGISQGIFDIYTNIYTLNIWKTHATNYVQILHGTFGLGSLLTPLLVKPFLLPLVQNSSANDTDQSDDAVLGAYTPDDVKVQYPFVVVGVLLIFASMGFLFFYFTDSSTRKNNASTKDEKKDSQDYATWKICLAVTAVALIAHTTFGVETLIGSLAPAFVVKSDLKMSKQDGANVVTMFWTLFTFYRLIFIALTSFFKERYLMYFSYTTIIVSVILMTPSAAYSRLIAWISLGLLGIGFSPTFSVSLGFLQKYIQISNRSASFIFIVAAIGEAVHPWIVTKFMDEMPQVFIYYTGFLSTVQILLCFILPFVCRQLFKGKPKIPLDRNASIRSSQR